MTTTITKGQIGEQDLKKYDGTGTNTGLTNTCTVDLSAHGAIAGTWGYIVL